jgi:hypothetical protein
MLESVAEEEVRRAREGIEADYPGWQVWASLRYYQAPLWCAKRHTEAVASLQADSPDELRALLAVVDDPGTNPHPSSGHDR